jgi:hypothetical protein
MHQANNDLVDLKLQWIFVFWKHRLPQAWTTKTLRAQGFAGDAKGILHGRIRIVLGCSVGKMVREPGIKLVFRGSHEIFVNWLCG